MWDVSHPGPHTPLAQSFVWEVCEAVPCKLFRCGLLNFWKRLRAAGNRMRLRDTGDIGSIMASLTILGGGSGFV